MTQNTNNDWAMTRDDDGEEEGGEGEREQWNLLVSYNLVLEVWTPLCKLTWQPDLSAQWSIAGIQVDLKIMTFNQMNIELLLSELFAVY